MMESDIRDLKSRVRDLEHKLDDNWIERKSDDC